MVKGRLLAVVAKVKFSSGAFVTFIRLGLPQHAPIYRRFFH